jgi:glycosyltransferase involved in cell wall biosynthesis
VEIKATIVVPTTGDRGSLLRYSVGSALAQTESAIEVLIIGDGVADPTRRVIADISERDSRVRFYDHPKHLRRGEEYRHAALAQARGEIVCYLTDRDLFLPNHVEAMAGVLVAADFGHTLRFSIEPEGLSFPHVVDIESEKDRAAMRSRAIAVDIPLSCVGHRLATYRKLPFGWRTTPRFMFTDVYMWHQFLDEPDLRVASSIVPTVLYFKRGDHPGWPVEQRLAEIRVWHERVQTPGWYEGFVAEVHKGIIRDRARLDRPQRSRTRQLLRRWVFRHPRLVETLLPAPSLQKAARNLFWYFLGRTGQ